MYNKSLKTTFVLSIIIAILMLIASLGGLLIDDLYRDNKFISLLWRGNDLVTLVIAFPMLIASIYYASRDSLRAQIILFGVIVFTLYNYAFYLFAAAFNWFFWIYTALFSLSIFALIFGLTRIDVHQIARKINTNAPVKWISGFIAVFSAFMGSMWIVRSLSFFTTGEVPQDIVQTGHPTGIVYALDLSIVVPFMLLSAVWLWQGEPWGYVLAAMLMVKGFMYPMALVVMSLISAYAGTGYDPLTPFYAVICLGCMISCGLLLGNITTEKEVQNVSYT